MGKIVQRVPKRHLILAISTVIILILSNSQEKEMVIAKSDSLEMYVNPMMEKMLKEKIEKEKRIKEANEIVIPAPVKPVEDKKPITNVKPKGDWETYKLTHYVANCKGCTGITRAEIDVRNITEYQGYKVIAVDKRKIPLGSIVQIKDGDNSYEAIAIDTGGAIKGNKLDLLVGSVKEAKNLGVKKVELKVVRTGWQEKRK